MMFLRKKGEIDINIYKFNASTSHFRHLSIKYNKLYFMEFIYVFRFRNLSFNNTFLFLHQLLPAKENHQEGLLHVPG